MGKYGMEKVKIKKIMLFIKLKMGKEYLKYINIMIIK